MTAFDPYEAPQAEALELSAGRRTSAWRGVAWFMAPLVALTVTYAVYDDFSAAEEGDMAILAMAFATLALPAAGVGYASGHALHRTGWWRYLAVVVIAAAVWAVFSAFLFIAIVQAMENNSHPLRLSMLVAPARMSLLTIPVSVVLATTLRLFHRRP
jgi:hypothetical protein